MYYLFVECPDGDWELLAKSRNFQYLSKLEDELCGRGIMTCVTGW